MCNYLLWFKKKKMFFPDWELVLLLKKKGFLLKKTHHSWDLKCYMLHPNMDNCMQISLPALLQKLYVSTEVLNSIEKESIILFIFYASYKEIEGSVLVSKYCLLSVYGHNLVLNFFVLSAFIFCLGKCIRTWWSVTW